MFIEIVRNIAILLALCMGYSIIARKTNRQSVAGQSIVGILFGFITVIGMHTPVTLTEGLFFDGRSILLAVAGLFGGWIAALLAGLIALIARIEIGGVGVWMGCGVIVTSAALGAAHRKLRHGEMTGLRIRDLYLLGLVVHVMMVFWMMGLPLELRWQALTNMGLLTIAVYPFGVVLAGLLLADQERYLKSQERLRESEHRQKLLLENLPLKIFLKDRNGAFITCNENFSRELGLKPEEVVGKTDFDFFATDLAEKYRRDDLRVIESGKLEELEESHHIRGRDVFVQVVKTPVQNERGKTYGLLGIYWDITERKVAERALRDSEERLRQIAENIAEVFWISSKDWTRILYISPAFDKIWQQPRERICENPQIWLETVVEEDRSLVADTIREKSRDACLNPDFPEYRIRRPDGTIRWIQARAFPIFNEAGQFYRVAGIAEDITEDKKAEEEHHALEAQIQHSQKLESLGVLAGGIAHDFNNLLMSILGNADMALQDLSPDAPARDCIDEILKASKRAAALSKQMLAYSGKGRFEIRALNLGEIIEEMAFLLESSMSKNIVLKRNIQQDLPPIEADATQVQQIVMNLITNAAEAIGEAGGIVTVSVSCRNVTDHELSRSRLPEIPPAGPYVCFEVRDTGCGMDRTALEKLFDPFYTTKFTGRGLGLSAVLGIMRGHKGAIIVNSAVGKGTTFTVLFPIAEGCARPDATAKAPASGADWQGAGSILLVDDEEQVRAIGRRMLERMGFEVQTANDGQEAVDLFRERKGDFCCVILDLTMPVMDGIEAFRRIHAIREDVPVLISSGYSEEDVIGRFKGVKPAGTIEKPYTMSVFKENLKKILESDPLPNNQ